MCLGAPIPIEANIRESSQLHMWEKLGPNLKFFTKGKGSFSFQFGLRGLNRVGVVGPSLKPLLSEHENNLQINEIFQHKLGKHTKYFLFGDFSMCKCVHM
jgi:hypothetical protein